MRKHAILLLMLAWPAARGEGGGERHVTAVRFWSLSGVTRIAIETDGDFHFRSDRLPNPDRLFFDVVGATPELGQRKGTKVIRVDDRFVKQIRVAETQRDVTRVVLDIAGQVEATTSRLENPSRLIIELRAPGTAATTTEAPKAPVFQPPTVAASVPRATPAPATALIETPPTLDVAPSLPAPPAAFPARRNSKGDRSMIRVLGLKVGRIVIDAGHGGHDTGTIAPDGYREKDLALDVAKRLGALIEDRLGSEVIYTRSDDTFVPLERRTEIANNAKADLFLSVHANASTLRTASGVETYYLNFTTSKTALDVAARENAGAARSVYDLQDLLEKIALKDKVEESREFATRVQDSLWTISAHSNAKAKDRGVRKAPFVVLIGATMPSILAEIGFISNAHDESLMKKAEHRQRIAEALYKGVASYAGTLSHFQVAQKR